MIKKLLSCMALGALVLTACSSEEPIVGTGDGNVNFTATLPAGIQSRSAYDDGTVATALTYAVYDADGNNIAALNPAAAIQMADKKGQVSLNLVTGKTYTVVFWAAATNAPYAFAPATGEVTVTTTGAANDVNRDAFFAAETFTVTGAINKTVELRRPFAQINIGTSDLADFQAAGGAISKSGLKVKACNKLNLISGVASGETDYEFTNADLVADTETFPVGTGYRWLTANHVLVGTDKATVDVVWTSDNTDRQEVAFNFVPVQRNYRTNIYGALLTNPAEYNVVINNEFAGPDLIGIVTDEASLRDAFNDPEITTVKLAEDLTLSSQLVISAESTTNKIDLAGHTLNLENTNSNAKAPVLVVNSAEDFIITDGTIESDALQPIRCNYSNVTMEKVEIKLDNTSEYTSIRCDGCDIHLKDVTIVTDGSGFELLSWSIDGKEYYTNFYAENCKFYQNSGFLPEDARGDLPMIFSWNGSENMTSANSITLKNCDISSYRGIISTNFGENVTIEGGTYATFKSPTENMAVMTPPGLMNSNNVVIKNARLYNEIVLEAGLAYFDIIGESFTFENVLTKDAANNNSTYFFIKTQIGNTSTYSNTYAIDHNETATLVMPDGKTTKTVVFDKKIEKHVFPTVAQN